MGLKKETADCILVKDAFEINHYLIFSIEDIDETLENEMCDEPIPAWSLHRLLCLIPKEYRYDIDASQFFVDAMICSDPYTETIELIRLLLEDGYIYDEYLNV